MATKDSPDQPQPTARPPASSARPLADRDVMVDSPAPKHGDPAENLGPQESVIGVRVGSEASVESGTDPVLPAVAGNVSEMTKVRNRDLQERDRKEFEKRGSVNAANSIGVSFEGLMMIEADDREPQMVSGSYTGSFNESLTIRRLTEEELEEHLPQLAPANRQAVDRRASDLIKGAGQGGGGNPMKAGEARGTTSGVTQPAGGSSVTSGPIQRPGVTSRSGGR